MIPTLEQLLLDMEANIKQLHASAELDSFQDKWEDLKRRIKDMQKDQHFLQCLRNAGVDNWDGYYYAGVEYREKYPDEDD